MYSFTIDGTEYRNFDLNNPEIEQDLRQQLGDAKVDEILANKGLYTTNLDLQLSVDKTQINAGGTITVTVKSIPSLDVTVDLLIDGPPINELVLVGGVGQDTFTFVDVGKYLIEVLHGDIRKHLFVEVV